MTGESIQVANAGGSGSNNSPATAPGSAPGQIFVVGQWYPQNAAVVTTVSAVENDAYAYPFVVNTTHKFPSIGCDVTAGGGTGSVIRFGLYADNGSGYPGALITDFGTVASTGTGLTEITPVGGITITPGLYWLVLCSQVGTAPTVTADNGFVSPVFGTGAAGLVVGQNRTGYRGTSGFSGALPNPFTAGQSAVATTAIAQVVA